MSPIQLYRSLLRYGKQIQDYNFRSYAIRRIKYGFQQHRQLTKESDDATIQKAMKDGIEQLNVLQRQATISQLYPSAQSVMESSLLKSRKKQLFTKN